MNTDNLNSAVYTLLKSLPYITTLLDSEARVIRQFNAEGSLLVTESGTVFLADRSAELLPLLHETVRTARPTRFEAEVNGPDGASRWFEHDIVFLPDSVSRIVLSRDISDSKKKTDDLERIKRRYDAIFNNVSDAIAISTWGTSYDDNILLYINRRTEELTGYSFEEIRTMRPSDILVEDYKQTAFKNRALRDADQFVQTPLQFPIKHKNGTIRFVESLGFVIHDDQGEKIETISMVRDVTKRVEREEQLRQAKLAAEAALTARDVFVANMSEELRRPLNAILAHSRLLCDSHSGASDFLIAHISQIQHQAERLERQIRDVLDVSRVEAGFDVLEPSVFHLPFLFKRLHENFAVQVRQSLVTLNLQLADDLPMLVLMDEAKLKQIVSNLITAAFKQPTNKVYALSLSCIDDNHLQIMLEWRSPGPLDSLIMMEECLELRICRRLAEVMDGDVIFEQSQDYAAISITLTYIPGRSESSSEDLPALPSIEDLLLVPNPWLETMGQLCTAGQYEEALAHIHLIESTFPEAAVQMRALVQLFYMDKIADVIVPLI